MYLKFVPKRLEPNVLRDIALLSSIDAMGESTATIEDGKLLFQENENYSLVDALPYIDTQLGQTEVMQQVKALIEEEMGNFYPRDYLASLLAPKLPVITGEAMQEQMARIDAGEPLGAIDTSRYKIEKLAGLSAQDHGAWKKAAEGSQAQLEYNRLRLTNLALLERYGSKAWVAHSIMARASEHAINSEVATLRSSREAVNKKRKLDQVSCGNELRKLNRELEQYQQDNSETLIGLQQLESDVARLKRLCVERGVKLADEVEAETDMGVDSKS